MKVEVRVHTAIQKRRNKDGRGRNNKSDAMEIAGKDIL
jgi:hypothetical protein